MRYTPTELRDFDLDSLQVGQGARMHHDECSFHKYDKTLSITRTPEGLVYHCYRCGVKGFVAANLDPRSAARYLKRRQTQREAQDCDIIELPWDTVPMCQKPNRIPSKAYAWLYQYELDDQDLCTYNIGFSEKLQRIIMPIYQVNELVGWIGRDIHYTTGCGRQKYHNEFKGGGRVYFSTDSISNEMDTDTLAKPVIVCEDIISAIKCGKATGYVAIALLNTSVGDNNIRDIFRKFPLVYLWLDPDARIKALRQVFKYKQQGINIRTVDSDGDPKEIPISDIQYRFSRN